MTTSSDECLIGIKNLNVRFEFRNLKPDDLLSNVSFDLKRGHIYFLLGGNGTGKTSLLKTLIGLLPENTRTHDKFIQMPNGSVISGADLPRNIKVGYIPQHPHEALIPSFNVSENISFRTFLRENYGFSDWIIKQRYGKNLEEKIEHIVRSFEITRKLIEPKLHHGVTHLSGGEQQILNLAAMVFDQCELLIMDEPTSKLDTKNRNEFWEFIKEIKQSKKHTMLIVTHDAMSTDISTLADKIYQIDSGRILQKSLTKP